MQKAEIPCEIWVPVYGYEGFYECSNFGRIRSVTRKSKGKNSFGSIIRTYYSKILSQNKSPTGHLAIELNKEKFKKRYGVHRLIYFSFIGEIEKGMLIHHKDGNKENNMLSNLEKMDSTTHNNIHKHPAWNKGLQGFCSGKRDTKIYNSRRKKVRNKTTGEIFNSVNEAAESLQCRASAISNALHNLKYSARGQYFEFAK